MTARAELRRGIRAARRRLAPGERATAAEELANRFAHDPWFRNARRIAAYFANDGELDPLPLMERAWKAGKQVCVPILSPVTGNRLWFSPYRPGEVLAANRFGIPEPIYTDTRLLPPWTLDLVLTPLVAFDPQGNRLGMGGGYYDRTFAYLRCRNHWRKPRLVGLAYEMQKVERLPCEPWDIPLAGVATEHSIYGPDGNRARSPRREPPLNDTPE